MLGDDADERTYDKTRSYDEGYDAGERTYNKKLNYEDTDDADERNYNKTNSVETHTNIMERSSPPGRASITGCRLRAELLDIWT